MYQSDLSDEEWALVSHHSERKDPRGKPIHSKCAIVNAVLYINKSGAQWRMLPKDYPSWKVSVYERLLSGGAGYRGAAVDFVEQVLGLKMHISECIQDVFAVLIHSLDCGANLCLLGNFRRLSKDYEVRTRSAENMVRIAMLRLIVAKYV